MKCGISCKLIVFLFIFSFIAILISLNLDSVREIIKEDIGIYSYPAVLVFSFLADFTVQPIGPEVPGIFALFLGLNFYLVLFFVLLGSYVGSFASYFIGRDFLDLDIKKNFRKKSRKKYYIFLKKYGRFGLFVASISPVPYVLFCWIAGTLKMRFLDFVIFGLIPRTLRIWVILSAVKFLF